MLQYLHMQDITTPEELEAVIKESHTHPVAILKHSLTCPISRAAHGRVEESIESGALKNVHRIVIQDSRDLSTAIAERFGVQHESPQLLMLMGGEVVHHASHYKIQPDGPGNGNHC